MTVLKSIAAVVAGMVFIVVLSTGTDWVLQHSILPAMNTPQVTPALLGLALVYRATYGVCAGWITAKLAPNYPLRHALILGAIGMAFAALGTYVMWSFPDHWYPLALTLLALPQTWLGGRLAIGSKRL
jgi:hypothetical protein